MFRHIVLVLLGTFALVPLVYGLYEDQVGKFDWRHQFVGRVQNILRPSINLWQDHQSLIVSTRSNVLAGLYLRNGSIHWRHPFESNPNTGSAGAVDFLSSGFENIRSYRCPVLSVNNKGRYIRCWTSDGLLLAEHNLPAEFMDQLERQASSDYTFLYDTFVEPTSAEPTLLLTKITYSTYLVEFFTYGLKSFSFERAGRFQAGRWLSPKTSCQLLGRSGTSKSLVCASVDGLELHILPVDLKSSSQKQFKRIPLTSFGLKTEQSPKYLAIDQLPYQSVEEPEDRTTTISSSSKPGSKSNLFGVNLGGDGFLLLSLQYDPVDPTVELVKILPKAVKLTIIPLMSSETSASSGTDSSLVDLGLAVLFAKENALKYQSPEEGGQNQERVFAAKLVIFHLQKWTEIASLSSEQILLEFGSKSAISPIVSSGKLVKRLDSSWSIDQFEIVPIRIVSLNTRTNRNQYRYTYKLVIGTSDGTLIVLNLSGKVNWAREEALAEVVTSVMLDLPLSETDASLEQEYSYDENKKNIVWLFVNRINTQLSQLSSLFKSIKHWIAHARHHHHSKASVQQDQELDGGEPLVDSEFQQDIEDEDDEEEVLVRDYFGLHKLIVLRTKVGKLYALDSLTGKVVWSKYEPSLRLNSDEPKFPIWVQRTSAHFPFSALCTFLTESVDNPNESILYSFNPFTGRLVDSKTLSFAITQAMLVHTIHDSEFRRPIVYLDSAFEAHLYPDSAPLRELFARQTASNYYMLLANRTSNQVVGYSFAKSDPSTGPVASPVWSFKLPQMGAPQIVNMAVIFKRANEHVHSQGRVLGDRNVLYKYLNPNLVAVVWELIDSQDKPLITLYLIDSITGNIVYSTVHRRARGPIQIVHSENWVIYSYYNEKVRRNEVSSIELYEGFEQVNGTAFSSIGRDLLTLPIAEQQSFIFPTGIGIMTDTETQKGITNKHILISLPTGGLLELPRAFLDPRRPIKPTPEHAEEGLIPYVPELPIPSEALINYNQTIFGVKGIQTGPTSLESTSLVFAYGLDIFYTRVTPSKTFDILKDDFDYLLISAVLFAMLAFSYLAKLIAARKSLNAAWK